MKEPRRLTPEELAEFVKGLCEGKIFTSAQVQDTHMIGQVFPALIVPTPSAQTPQEIHHFFKAVGVAWEWLDQAGARSVQGHPVFPSAKLMHIADWEAAYKAYQGTAAARKRPKEKEDE
jgi:hypothetical protein